MVWYVVWGGIYVCCFFFSWCWKFVWRFLVGCGLLRVEIVLLFEMYLVICCCLIFCIVVVKVFLWIILVWFIVRISICLRIICWWGSLRVKGFLMWMFFVNFLIVILLFVMIGLCGYLICVLLRVGFVISISERYVILCVFVLCVNGCIVWFLLGLCFYSFVVKSEISWGCGCIWLVCGGVEIFGVVYWEICRDLLVGCELVGFCNLVCIYIFVWCVGRGLVYEICLIGMLVRVFFIVVVFC